MSMPIYALSVANRVTTPSPGSAASQLAPIESDFTLAACSPLLQYIDFSSSLILRLPFPSSLPNHSAIFNRVSHPYDPDAFDFFLTKHGLLDYYPLLSINLQNGFPLGHMPPLLHTIVFPNNPSSFLYTDAVDEYLCKEPFVERMSGLFSHEEMELIMRGPFQSSPLIVVVQPQHPGIPNKLWICRHLSKSTKTHPSVNSHILKDDFPTRFDVASKVAKMVSFRFIYFPTIFSSSLALLCVSCVEMFSIFCKRQFRVFASRTRYPDILSSSGCMLSACLMAGALSTCSLWWAC